MKFDVIQSQITHLAPADIFADLLNMAQISSVCLSLSITNYNAKVYVIAHSASKWIGGHGNVIAGVVVDSGKFDWAKSGRFPAFTEPTEGYHGLRYVDQFGKKAFAAKMRLELMRDIGLTLNPFAGWLLIQGRRIIYLCIHPHILTQLCRVRNTQPPCAETFGQCIGSS